MKKARVLVLDVGKSEVREAECESLDDFYRELNCDTFDITCRKIAGRYYDIFCDDNGLFVEDPKVSAIDSRMSPMLVGNLVFANHDSQGNTTSLTDEDIAWINANILMLVGDGFSYPVVYPCDY